MSSSPDDLTSDTPQRIRDIAYGIVPIFRIRMTMPQLLWMAVWCGLGMCIMSYYSNPGPLLVYIVIPIGYVASFILVEYQRGTEYRQKNKRLLQTLERESRPQDAMDKRLAKILDDPAVKPDTLDESLARILLEAECGVPYFSWKEHKGNTWHVLAGNCAVNGHGIPSTIATRTHRKALESIELKEAMLEPEMILDSVPMRQRWVIVIMVIFLALGVWSMAKGYWFDMAMYLCVAGFFAFCIPAIRDLFPNTRPEVNAPIVGMGFIQDAKKLLWTVDDSFLILTGKGTEDGPVELHFIGPAGKMALAYTNLTDPEFIKLWQRWNHPQPRPELAPLALS